jgi:hypothetical protein
MPEATAEDWAKQNQLRQEWLANNPLNMKGGCYMKFAYADPPYCKARSYMELHDLYDLIDRLMSEYPDGWALSCNPAELPWMIKHDGIRVCAWAKTFHQITQAYGA